MYTIVHKITYNVEVKTILLWEISLSCETDRISRFYYFDTCEKEVTAADLIKKKSPESVTEMTCN